MCSSVSVLNITTFGQQEWSQQECSQQDCGQRHPIPIELWFRGRGNIRRRRKLIAGCIWHIFTCDRRVSFWSLQTNTKTNTNTFVIERSHCVNFQMKQIWKKKWSPSSHQVLTKWTPSGHQVVTKWSPSSRQVVIKSMLTFGWMDGCALRSMCLTPLKRMFIG